MSNFMINSKNSIRKLKKSCIFIIILVLMSSLSGCFLLPKEEAVLAPPLIEPPKITYETVEVKAGNIEKKIMVNGSFASIYQENLYFKFRGGNLKGFNVKLGDKVKAGDLLAELDTDSLESQIKQQEITVKISELSYDNKKANPQTSSNDIEVAALNLQSTKLKLDDLKKEYEKAKLYSTISGDVVYVEPVNAGDYVNANKTLITIADPTKLQLIYKGDDSSNFQQGVKVSVKYKSQAYEGEVVSAPMNLPIDANKNVKNSVYIKLNNLPQTVAIGESAEITLVLDKRENVMVVPRNLINNYSGRNYVQVLENGIKYEKDVEIGLQTATEVEVKKGIKLGDMLIQR